MKKINDYIAALGLNLSAEQTAQLEQYVDMVWQKKEEMNLTSVDSKEEIWARHICDALAAAAFIKNNFEEDIRIADLGAGAGYIGLAAAIALPLANVTVVESLEKRCSFMRWVVLKLRLKNVNILNERAVKGDHGRYHIVLERAMGKLEDILEVCLSYVMEGGVFIPFQSERACGESCGGKAAAYKLPCDEKERYLILIKKNGHS